MWHSGMKTTKTVGEKDLRQRRQSWSKGITIGWPFTLGKESIAGCKWNKEGKSNTTNNKGSYTENFSASIMQQHTNGFITAG